MDSQGVHLLTIHKSKGLEFPIVIIPWMELGSRTNSSMELWGKLEIIHGLYKEQFFTVDIGFPDRIQSKANILQTRAQDLLKEKMYAETKRLFYVACTRAIDHLIFFEATPMQTSCKSDSFHALFLEDQREPRSRR